VVTSRSLEKRGGGGRKKGKASLTSLSLSN